MDFLKITKVENVRLEKSQVVVVGTLHLTTHQMIFKKSNETEELWISYPIIHTVERRSPTSDPKSWPLFIKCRNFVFVMISIPVEQEAIDVFDTIQKLTCISSISQVYAFDYMPEKEFECRDGWKVYDARQEFSRMGVAETKAWRFTDVNQNYSLCPTYPSVLVVPYKISDIVLNHAAKFRSKNRIPVLSYLHNNKASITRSSQPMVGIQKKRSIQDEKLIQAIFESNLPVSPNGKIIYGSTPRNLIIDARPTANAMANTAMGAGSENTDYYKNCEKKFKGIDNIHVMRDSLMKIVEVLQIADSQGLSIKKYQLDKSNWLKHISTLLASAYEIIENVNVKASHVLIHCSDGWDRTAQLTSISELCLDPYYRTFRGFQVLIEKEWVSFGHKFSDRSGHLSNERYFINTNVAGSAFNTVQSKFYKQSHVREISPVFHQFLDCVYQLFQQNPKRFEFNEKFLVGLHDHCYSCQFGTFLFNSEKERKEYNVTEKTYSVWDYFNSEKEMFLNLSYCGEEEDRNQDMGVLYPDTDNLKYWAKLFRRKDEELNRNGNGDESEEGFGARLRWKSDNSGSRSGSPVITTDPLEASTLNGGSDVWNTNLSSLERSMMGFDLTNPWKSHSTTNGDDNSSKETLPLEEEKETNSFNSVQNFAKYTFKNIATFASKMSIDLDGNSILNRNSNSNGNSGNATPTEEGSRPSTPKLREMMSFGISETNSSEVVEDITTSTNSTNSTNSNGGQGQFPTLFLRRENNRNYSLSSLGIRTTPPASPYLRTNSGSSTPIYEKQTLTSPISSSPNSNSPPKSGLIELENSMMASNANMSPSGLVLGLNFGGDSGNNSNNSSEQPSRSNSLSAIKSLGGGNDTNSRNSSPLSTPPIPSSPSIQDKMKELPHPLYNVDPLSSP